MICPAETLHKWKERATLHTKIAQFSISNSRGGFVQKSEEDFYLWFFFFFLITSCSSNCPTHSDALCINFSFFRFHITKLHFYSHVFKFQFLLRSSGSQPLPRICSSPHARQLRLQNSCNANFYLCHRTGFKRLLVSLTQRVTLAQAQTEFAPWLHEVGRRHTPSLTTSELS